MSFSSEWRLRRAATTNLPYSTKEFGSSKSSTFFSRGALSGFAPPSHRLRPLRIQCAAVAFDDCRKIRPNEIQIDVGGNRRGGSGEIPGFDECQRAALSHRIPARDIQCAHHAAHGAVITCSIFMDSMTKTGSRRAP